eukprot:9494149-Pyramimonas_sp.AAC.1
MISPQLVQAIADRARIDFEKWISNGSPGVPDDLAHLADLGSRGAHPNNCHNGLMRCLDGVAMPTACKFSAPCKTPRDGTFADRDMDMILPHELFASLYHNYPAHWRAHVCSSPGDLEQFWRDVDSHPSLEGNPVKDDPNWRSCTVPLSVHGDGVPIKGVGKCWSESMNIYSWCSMLAGQGTTIEYNFYIRSIFCHLVSSKLACRTMNTFWKIMRWSLTALFTGRWPTTDWDNKPINNSKAGTWLAGGYKGMLFCIKGDLEYF